MEVIIISPNLWNVVVSMRLDVSLRMRSFSSLTEAFVKDRRRISSGWAFSVIRSSLTRPMMVVVFPVPAPAMTRRVLTSMAMEVSCCLSRSLPSTGLIMRPTSTDSLSASSTLCLWASPGKASYLLRNSIMLLLNGLFTRPSLKKIPLDLFLADSTVCLVLFLKDSTLQGSMNPEPLVADDRASNDLLTSSKRILSFSFIDSGWS